MAGAAGGALAATPQGAALSTVAGAAAGGPATSGSNQDTNSAFGTGAKSVTFGPPPARNAAVGNPYVVGGLVLAMTLVAIVWLKNRR